MTKKENKYIYKKLKRKWYVANWNNILINIPTANDPKPVSHWKTVVLGGDNRNALWKNLPAQKGISKDASTCIKMWVMQTPVFLKIQVTREKTKIHCWNVPFCRRFNSDGCLSSFKTSALGDNQVLARCRVMYISTLSLSGTVFQTLPELVTPLKGCSSSPCSCPWQRQCSPNGLSSNTTVQQHRIQARM